MHMSRHKLSVVFLLFLFRCSALLQSYNFHETETNLVNPLYEQQQKNNHLEQKYFDRRLHT